MKKPHQKELIITPLNQNQAGNLITASVSYNNYLIGTFQLNKVSYPPISNAFGAPFVTNYEYTLIFDEKNILENKQLNVATNSVQTNGFFKISGGTFIITDLGLPIGTYKNIGTSPDGNKYNLVLINEDTQAKIILNRIC